ncbi:MAG: hypothetical protein JNM18_16135 [Planctomycetaceae bacterium]|nr:hypothetical protein [Planctomycetaceae bacterium]
MVTFVHNTGHNFCGWLRYGTLGEADLVPWRLSHSTVDPNPRPPLIVRGGPILGVLVP